MKRVNLLPDGKIDVACATLYGYSATATFANRDSLLQIACASTAAYKNTLSSEFGRETESGKPCTESR